MCVCLCVYVFLDTYHVCCCCCCSFHDIFLFFYYFSKIFSRGWLAGRGGLRGVGWRGSTLASLRTLNLKMLDEKHKKQTKQKIGKNKHKKKTQRIGSHVMCVWRACVWVPCISLSAFYQLSAAGRGLPLCASRQARFSSSCPKQNPKKGAAFASNWQSESNKLISLAPTVCVYVLAGHAWYFGCFLFSICICHKSCGR